MIARVMVQGVQKESGYCLAMENGKLSKNKGRGNADMHQITMNLPRGHSQRGRQGWREERSKLEVLTKSRRSQGGLWRIRVCISETESTSAFSIRSRGGVMALREREP